MIILGAIEIRRRTKLNGLKIFLASLREHAPNQRVVIFSRAPELTPMLEAYGAEVLPLTIEGPIENVRFLAYLEWLDRNPMDAICCDTLDVVWQDSPDQVNLVNLLTAQENKINQDCPFNRKWITHQSRTPLELLPKTVVCCGVIGGTYSALKRYLEFYTTFPGLEFRGHDTAALAQYLADCQLPSLPYANKALMHLGYAPEDKVRWFKRVVCEEHAPVIVHQYNRHPGIVAQLEAKYGLN